MTSRLQRRAAPTRSLAAATVHSAVAPSPGAPGAGARAGAGPGPVAPAGQAMVRSIQEHRVVRVPFGHRVMVVGALGLGREATASSRAAADALTDALARWDGPGLVVVSGALVDLAPDSGAGTGPLGAYPGLADAIKGFTSAGRRMLVVARGDGGLLGGLGVEWCGALDLELEAADGVRRVAVRTATPAEGIGPATPPAPFDGDGWLGGIDRLEDPGASERFVTSRTLYRRLARYSWLVVAPAIAAVLLSSGRVIDALDRMVGASSAPSRVLRHAYGAGWADRALAAILVTACVVAVLAAAEILVSRRVWRALGGGDVWRRRPAAGSVEEPGPSLGLAIDGVDALDAARALAGAGADGVVIGGSTRAELIDLHPGFIACPGRLGDVVREHRGRAGLPPVFVAHRQVSWLELRCESALRLRLVLADGAAPGATATERLCAVGLERAWRSRVTDPAVVASWPDGGAWPPPPADGDHRATRRVRRVAAGAILAAGAVDLLEAVRPPGPGHLRAVELLLSLGDVEAARALMAFAGVALVMLARGLLRGQRRAWAVAVGMLSATMVLRVAAGALVSGVGLSALVLVLLVVQRRRFAAGIDHRSWRSAAGTVAAGGGLAVGGAFAAVELSHVHAGALPMWPRVLGAVMERLVGIQSIALPVRVNQWVSPSLLAVGCAVAIVAAFLATRPVVDRRLSSGSGGPGPGRRVAERRARDIVRRHGSGSLDYFSLRDDKQWYFHRDTLVAYAVHGGVCLVSPDPIGPVSERAQAWAAFRRFADRHGWAVGVVGASESWLPVFRSSGMRHAYIGDEAIVAVQEFSLAGGRMKGLRQACARVERKGYRVEIGEPASLDPATRDAVRELVGANRRGRRERGFSMTLGRLFDAADTDLLLTVVYGPGDRPVAVCQFVPARGIGGYSLDLMRRDPGEHPNGLLDYALCATIEHLRGAGKVGLSLNFAALRATLEGETGNGVAQRVERWALRRLSGIFQIESLWRFNAKYQPAWQPRYVVFDSAEQFVPTVVNILRAESLNELPVIGRLLAIGERRAPRGEPDAAAHAGADTDDMAATGR